MHRKSAELLCLQCLILFDSWCLFVSGMYSFFMRHCVVQSSLEIKLWLGLGITKYGKLKEQTKECFTWYISCFSKANSLISHCSNSFYSIDGKKHSEGLLSSMGREKRRFSLQIIVLWKKSKSLGIIGLDRITSSIFVFGVVGLVLSFCFFLLVVLACCCLAPFLLVLYGCVKQSPKYCIPKTLIFAEIAEALMY